MRKRVGSRTSANRTFAKKRNFAGLLVRLALAMLAILAIIWAANQAMFFLFRHGLY